MPYRLFCTDIVPKGTVDLIPMYPFVFEDSRTTQFQKPLFSRTCGFTYLGKVLIKLGQRAYSML